MSSSIPTRREMLAWMLALATTFAAIMAIDSDRADAGFVEETTQVAYIATGANYPDALAAAATAALGLGPVLLVQKDEAPAPTIAELNRLDPPQIYIIGGIGVISDTVKTQLEALSFSPTVTRIAGSNRYETAAALSQAVFPTTGLYPRAAFSHSDTSGISEGGQTDLVTLTIDAPRPGILLVVAGADLADTPVTTEPACWITHNDLEVDGSRRWVESNGASSVNDDEDCTTEIGFAVDAGTHTIRLRISAVEGVHWRDRSLWALWVPFDSHGAYIADP